MPPVQIPVLRCASGAAVNPFTFGPENVNLTDISFSVSRIPFNNGQLRENYSIGQHALLITLGCLPQDGIYVLVKTAVATYVGVPSFPMGLDCVVRSPIDNEWYTRAEVEAAVGGMILHALRLPEPTTAQLERIAEAERRAVATVNRDLSTPTQGRYAPEIDPLPYKVAPLPAAKVAEVFVKEFGRLLDIAIEQPRYGIAGLTPLTATTKPRVAMSAHQTTGDNRVRPVNNVNECAPAPGRISDVGQLAGFAGETAQSSSGPALVADAPFVRGPATGPAANRVDHDVPAGYQASIIPGYPPLPEGFSPHQPKM